ncbi:MAG: class I SAM-dependent methyltransferase [bacterium]
MNNDKRIENEIIHGKLIADKGEQIWNWSSPAGKIRWKRRVDMFIKFLGNDNRKILEIGCGTGLFTEEIAKTNNKLTSIDISSELIELAKQRVCSVNVIFMLENAYNTNFIEDSFDFIIGSSVLHHLDIDLALKEFYRLLKPGGKIMFTEPNMLNPQISLQKNINFIKKITGDSPDETAFFKKDIKKKFVLYGFKNIYVEPFDFLHPAIPAFLIPFMKKITVSLEKIPVIREIAGSLVIQAAKGA